jgi:hypothetical protein
MSWPFLRRRGTLEPGALGLRGLFFFVLQGSRWRISEMGGSGLGNRWIYVLPAALGAMWLAVWLNVVGLRGKWLQNIGAIGSYLPGIVIVCSVSWP